MAQKTQQKHVVIDGRIRRASTGRPVDRLLEYLQQLDTTTRYTVLVEPDDPWQPTAANFTAVACKFRQFSFNPLHQITFAWQLHKLKPDLVHFTLTGQQPAFYFGNQTTFTHDLTMFNYVRAGRLPLWVHKLRMLGYRFLLWQSHRKSQVIIVPTEYVKQDVAKHYPFASGKLVVTLEASEPPIQGKAQAPERLQKPFILYVGSAFPHKNLDALVDAFGELHKTHPDLHLVFAGKRDRFAEELEAYANKTAAAKQIHFTGFVSTEELKWLYENTSCYVFTSLSEGFGLPGLEAMVHGAPVASSNATCLPEVYGDAAHYFDPRDPSDIAAKVAEVLDNPTLAKELIAKGHKQASKFSWKRMTQQTLEVFTQTLSK